MELARGEPEAEAVANANEDADAREGVIQTARKVGVRRRGFAPDSSRQPLRRPRAAAPRARKYLRSKNKQPDGRLAASLHRSPCAPPATSGARRRVVAYDSAALVARSVARRATETRAGSATWTTERYLAPTRAPPPPRQHHASRIPRALRGRRLRVCVLDRPDASRASPPPSCSALQRIRPVRRWHGKSVVPPRRSARVSPRRTRPPARLAKPGQGGFRRQRQRREHRMARHRATATS